MTDTLLEDYCPPADEIDSPTCEGKFLQLILDQHSYLVFSPSSLHRYHNQMLACFLQGRDIAHHWVTEERLTYDTARLRVLGGGRFRADAQKRILELWDDSHVFGRFEERGLAESIARVEHPWSSYEVRIS